MRRIAPPFILLITAVVTGAQPPAATSESSAPDVIGYIDADRDGINDRFRDGNGDGINDVSSLAYPHWFLFEDEDGDGVNDRYVDRDGDGVNDLDGNYVDRNEDGYCDNVIDHDADGRNDITGLAYTQRSLGGYRFGRVLEELRRVPPHFRDEDGDGMHDVLRGFHQEMQMRLEHGRDLFLDEDGDGIHDGRQLRRPPPRPLMEGKRGGMRRQPPPPPRDRPRPPPRRGRE